MFMAIFMLIIRADNLMIAIIAVLAFTLKTIFYLR